MPAPFLITARLNVELGNVSKATSDLKRQFSGINVPVNVNTTGATAGVGRLNSGLNATQSALQAVRTQAQSANTSLSATVQIAGQGASSLANFAEQAGLAARRFTAFTVAAGAMVQVVRGIREGVRAAVEFELSINKIDQVSNMTKTRLGELSRTITGLATNLGVSSAALAEVGVTLTQAGIVGRDAERALKAIALTDLAPTFDSMKQSTEGLIAAFRQFNLSSRDFESVLSSVNAVSGAFAVESADVVVALQKAGGAFKFSAGDITTGTEALNQFISLFSSVRATTRESADAIATGLRTVFTRFQRADTVKALADLQINLRYTREEAAALGQVDLKDQFVGAFEAVKRLSEGLAGLRETDPRYAQVVEQLGGYRQISRVIPLLKEFKTAQDALNVAQYGQLSLQIAGEKRLDTLANKTQRLKEEYLALFRSIVDSKGFQGLAGGLFTLANGFLKILEYARPLLPLFTALAAVKIGTGLGSVVGGFSRAFLAPPGASVKPGQGITKFASGGFIPGSGDGDTVPAMLTPGEFVIKKRSAERIGYGRLHQLNQNPQKFATGGKVRGPVDAGAPFSPDETEALSAYTLSPQVNVRLRLGQQKSARDEQRISLLTSALGKRRLAADTTLYRGVSGAERERIQASLGGDAFDPAVVGKEFTDPGFGSTSSSPKIASGFSPSGADRLVFKIRAPKGAPGADLSGLTKARSKKEQEFLLQRDARYRVVGRDGDHLAVELLTGEEPAQKFATGGRVPGFGPLNKFTTINQAVKALRAEKFDHPNAAEEKEVIAQHSELLKGHDKEEHASFLKRNIFTSAPAGRIRDSMVHSASDLFDFLVDSGHRGDGAKVLRFVHALGGKLVHRKGREYPLERGKFILPSTGVEEAEVGSSVTALASRFGIFEPGGVRTLDKTPYLATGRDHPLGEAIRKKYYGFASGGRVPDPAETSDYATTSHQKAAEPAAPPTGRPKVRKPLGPLANDALIRAVELLTRQKPKGYATGGSVPGTGNNDTELSLLTPGEFVLNKNAVAKLGVPALRDLNEGSSRLSIKKYAGGSRNFVGADGDGLVPSAAGIVDGPQATAVAAVFRSLNAGLSSFGATVSKFVRTIQATNEAVSATGEGQVRPVENVPPAIARLRARQAGQAVVSAPARPPRPADSSTLVQERLASEAEREAGDLAQIARDKAEVARIDALAAVSKKPEKDKKSSSLARLQTSEQQSFFLRHHDNVVEQAEARAIKSGDAGARGASSGKIGELASELFAKIVAKGTYGKAKTPVDRSPAGTAKYVAAFANYEYFKNNAEAAAPHFAIGSDSDDYGSTSGLAPEPAARAAGPAKYESAQQTRQRADLSATLAASGGKVPTTHGELIGVGRSLGLPGSIHNLPVGELKEVVYAGITETVKAGGPGTLAPVAPGGRPPKPPKAPGGTPFHGDDEPRPEKAKKPKLSPRDAALKRAADARGLTVENYLTLLRTETGGQRKAREGEFAAANQPEQTYQVQEDILRTRKPVPLVTNASAEVARANAEFANAAARSRARGSLDANISSRQPGAFGTEIFRPDAVVTAGILDRFNAGKAVRPNDPLAGDRELKSGRVLGSLAAQKGAEDRERVLGSLAQQRREEEARPGERLAERVRLAAEDQARRAVEVPASLAAQRRREQEKEGALTQRRTGGDFAKLAVFGASPDDRKLLREQRDLGANNDPLVLKQNAIRAFQEGRGGKDVLDSVQSKLSPAQFGQVVAASQRAGFDPKPGPELRTQTITQKAQTAAVDLATYDLHDDDSKTLTGGLVADRAKKLADERLARRGGESVLSEATVSQVRNRAAVEEETKARRELISAQNNLLAKLRPEISAVERHKIAVEDSEKAFLGQAKVAKDASGRILGLQGTVATAQLRGLEAPGAGGYGYAIQSRVSDRLAAVTNRLATPSALSERADGLLQRPGVGYGLFAAAGALGYAGNEFDKRAGSADDAFRSPTATADFKSNKGIAGGLQGAVIGASLGAGIGSVVPVVGTAIGGLVGAIAGGAQGVYSSLKEAENDIRQAKINSALTELGTKLSNFATGIADPSELAEVRTQLRVYDTEAAKRADEKAGGLFTSRDTTIKEYVAGYRADFRKEFGPLLPQIGAGLTKSADRLGRENAGAKPELLLARLKQDAGGVNGELIQKIASLRGTSATSEEEKIRKVIVEGQQAAKREETNKAARTGVEQNANTFGRLFLAVQSASDSLFGLQQRASALNEILDGQVGASRVSARTGALDTLGLPDGGALKALDLVAAVGGEDGKRLRSAGGAANDVSRELPGVLATVLGRGGLTPEAIGGQVTDALYTRLGFNADNAPADVKRAVTSVASGLNDAQSEGRGLGGILDEVKGDTSKFAEKLLAGFADPTKDFGARTARLLEDNANKLVDGLTSIQQRVQTVGQLYDQFAATAANNYRQKLLFDGDAQGVGRQLLENAPLAHLETAFDHRQQRLAENVGPAAFDPKFLGAELERVQVRIGGAQGAVERQQDVFDKTGAKGPEFFAAADELTRLKGSAANLQQALKHLADSSERNAIVQEKLQRIQQEKDSRLGLAERYATASPADKLRLNQGVLLANEAFNKKNFDTFSTDQKKLALDFVNAGGAGTATGFNGSPSFSVVKEDLLNQESRGAFQLTKDQKAEKDALQGTAAARGKTAEEAVLQLAKFQQDGVSAFSKSLLDQQSQFFTRLERLLGQNKLADLENQRGRAAAEKNALLGKGESASLLSPVGVTTTPQLEALRNKRPEIEELRNAILQKKSAEDRIDEAGRLLKGLPVGPVDAKTFLKDSFDEESAARIAKRQDEIFSSDAFRGKRAEVIDRFRRTDADPKQREAAIEVVRREALDRAIADERTAVDGGIPQLHGKVATARDALGGIAGVNKFAIEDVLAGPKADKFVKALDAFDGTNNKIEDFGKKLAGANTELARLDEEIAKLVETLAAARAAAPPGAVPVVRAAGGTIFRPQGTDTVPAMLTPGEFVVNAKSAAANSTLLHRINEARGAAYLASGGTVISPTTADDPERRKLEAARRRALAPDPNSLAERHRQKAIADFEAQTGTKHGSAGLSQKRELTDLEKESLAKEAAHQKDLAERAVRARAAVKEIKERGARQEAERLKKAATPQALDGQQQFNFLAAANPTGRSGQVAAEIAAAEAEKARQKREVAARRSDIDGKPTLTQPRSEVLRYRKIGQQLGLGEKADIDDVKRALVQRAADDAAGNLVVGAQQDAFNRAGRLSRRRTRPGEDGQVNVAQRVLGAESRVLDERAQTDERLKRFFGARVGAQGFAAGGIVPGAGVTDTVPAMLTPGEFVLNRRATSRAGAHALQHFNDGGSVGAPTGRAPSGSPGGEGFGRAADALAAAMTRFAQDAGGFGQASQQLAQAFNVFSGPAQALTQALNNMPRTMNGQFTHAHTVTHNGAEVFAQLTPALERLVTEKVNSAMNRVFSDQMPEAGVRLE